MWELLDIKKYASLSLQYSRGCPYDCDFCSITMLNGRNPRTKSSSQFIGELERINKLGYRGPISVVDDNFIGNKRKLKDDLLPQLIGWSKQKNYPFSYITEVTVNVADDEVLMDMIIESGFNSIFIGIETPSTESLIECGKSQNLKRNLVESVLQLLEKGFIVSGGFIVGFDSDPPSVFQEQIDFIQQSGIVSAMVGLLNAPRNTRLCADLVLAVDVMDVVLRVLVDARARGLEQLLARAEQQRAAGADLGAGRGLAPGLRPLQTIGYRQAVAVLEGRLGLGGLEEAITRATLQYAKRQRTWFRHQAEALWFPDAEAALAAGRSFLEPPSP